MTPIPSLKSAQGGAALIISLVMLVMVSLLAVGGFVATTGEARGAAGWGDRQRAIYLAETALRTAVDQAKTLSLASTNIQQTVANKGTGYYLRSNAFNILPWNEKTFDDNSIAVSSLAGMSGTSGRYAIVFEGMVSRSQSGGVVSGSASNAQTAQHPRFTLYAKAGGQRNGTLVVLSTSQEF